MKKFYALFTPLLLMGVTFTSAQVGINTEDPNATLDILAITIKPKGYYFQS